MTGIRGIFGANSNSGWKAAKANLIIRCNELATTYPDFNETSIKPKIDKLNKADSEAKFKKIDAGFEAWAQEIMKRAESAIAAVKEQRQKKLQEEKEAELKKINAETEAKLAAAKLLEKEQIEAHAREQARLLEEKKNELLALYCGCPVEFFSKDSGIDINLRDKPVADYDNEIETFKHELHDEKSDGLFPRHLTHPITIKLVQLVRDHELRRYEIKEQIQAMKFVSQEEKLKKEFENFEEQSKSIRAEYKKKSHVLLEGTRLVESLASIEEKLIKDKKLSPLFSEVALDDEVNFKALFADKAQRKQYKNICKSRLNIRKKIADFFSNFENIDERKQNIEKDIDAHRVLVSEFSPKQKIVLAAKSADVSAAPNNIYKHQDDQHKKDVLAILKKYQKSWRLADDRKKNVAELIAAITNLERAHLAPLIADLLVKAKVQAKLDDSLADSRACFFKRNFIGSRYQTALDDAQKECMKEHFTP